MVIDQWYIIILASSFAIVIFFIFWMLLQRSRHGRTKEALRTSEERYLSALSEATDGLWDWDIRSANLLFGSVHGTPRFYD
jgi:PAS domain-containing protein